MWMPPTAEQRVKNFEECVTKNLARNRTESDPEACAARLLLLRLADWRPAALTTFCTWLLLPTGSCSTPQWDRR